MTDPCYVVGDAVITGGSSSCGLIVAVPAEIVATIGVASMTTDFTNAVARAIQALHSLRVSASDLVLVPSRRPESSVRKTQNQVLEPSGAKLPTRRWENLAKKTTWFFIRF